MAVFHADGLVIRSREYGESDRLLTLFTREYGKIQTVAKGVRKPKSRQRAGAQLFTYGDFLLHRGKTLHTVNQASPRESFPHLWNDFDKSMAAANMAELLDLATLENQPQQELFTLTFTGFFLLDAVEPLLLQAAYALRLMSILGYRPNLEECAGCGETLKGERLFFNAQLGGLLCADCSKDAGGKFIRAGSIAFMRQLLSSDLTKLDRLRWNASMQEEVLETVQGYCESKLERSLRCWRTGKQMQENVGRHLMNRKDGDSDERSGVERAGEVGCDP